MYQSIILPHFKKQLKPHCKKYPRLKESIIEVLETFDKRTWPTLGHCIYKIRLKIKDLPKGKNKSFRMLVLVFEKEHYLAPITIYCKSEQKNMPKKEINNHLEAILVELKTSRLFANEE